MHCHPEHSICFAKRSKCCVEGPLTSVGQMNLKGFPRGCQVEIPCDDVARFKATGSFDCVVARFANDHFAQDDILK
jgi:hypothetical protein